MYLRQNIPQEFLGDLRNVSQSTVSRIVTALVPVVKAVLGEFVQTRRMRSRWSRTGCAW
jgi:Helix-turn-helix of DDE superfamily endonuclease